MSKRYKFTPKGPILIEIFPKHDDFAVRNVGLPGMIGALGACFGRVVTMDSPHARPPGEFQWEATLWHELAHVITLQMSNQRVPRWLTEGISVYEEKVARPEWARGMDMRVRPHAERRRDDQAARPERRVHRSAHDLARVLQASLLVEHIVETYGDDGLHKLLRAYGQGLDTDAALKAALDTDLDQLQAAFDQTLERDVREDARGAEGAAEGRGPPQDAARRAEGYAAKHQGSYIAQMALGERAAEGRRDRRARCGVRARRGAGADRDRRRQPARADRRDRAAEERTRRARSTRCRR